MRTDTEKAKKKKHKSQFDIELDSKIEQNKQLINKVQRILSEIKTTSKPTPDVCETKEVEEIISYETKFEGSSDASNKEGIEIPSTTSDTLQKPKEKIKKATVQAVKCSQKTNLLRPTTRRFAEEDNSKDDRFRTEPRKNNQKSPHDMTDFEILQAKLSAINETESEDTNVLDDILSSQSAETLIEKPRKGTLQQSNDVAYCADCSDELKETSNIAKTNQPQERDNTAMEIVSDIMKNLLKICCEPPEGVKCFEESLECSCRGKTKKYKDHSSHTSVIITSKDVTCSTDSLETYRNFMCNTETVQHIDCSVNTDLFETGVDFGCNALFNKESKDFGCDIKLIESNDFTCNTEFVTERKDFTCNTQVITNKDFTCNSNLDIDQRDFACSTNNECKDIDCNTEIKQTTEASCTTYNETVTEGTQKGKMDGTKMGVKQVEQTDIRPHSHLKKTSTLITQLLPSINIMSKPTFQKILHFYIDQDGNTHIEFKFASQRTAYYEVQSPSLCLKSESTAQDETKKEMQIQFVKSHVSSITTNEQSCEDFESSSSPIEIISSITTVQNFLPPDRSDLASPSNVSIRSGFLWECLDTNLVNLDNLTSGISDEELSDTQRLSSKMLFISPASTSCYSIKPVESKSTVTEVNLKALDAIEDSYEKEMVLKSYQLFDNKNVHDPGDLGDLGVSPFVNKEMDEAVYKTFINPDGIYSQNLFKGGKRVNLSDEKSTQTTKPKKPSDLKNSPQKSPKEKILDANKLFSLGLYETKETQTPQYRTREEESFEKISLTISYSTSSDELEVIEKDKEINLDSINGYRKKSRVSSPVPRLSVPAEETFRYLKEKIIKEHPASALSSLSDLSNVPKNKVSERPSYDELSYAEGPLYVSGIIQKDHDIIKKYVPTIKRSMKFGTSPFKSKHDVNKNSIDKNKKKQETEENNNRIITGFDETEFDKIRKSIEEKRKKLSYSTLTMMPIHVQGDSILVDKQRVVDDLYVGKNGRYRDERNLFSELNKNQLDISTSTGTTEKSFSDGEIRCHCSVSNGEIHVCKKGSPFKNFRKLCSFQKDVGITGIRRRRHYFNNMITYYFNKNSNINDSSSTS